MIVAADLLLPTGPLDTSLFPGVASNVLEQDLTTQINQAYADQRVAAQTDVNRKDQLARAYVLARAFTQVYIRMTTQPISLTVTEKGGHAFSSEQIRNVKMLADKYQADFDGLLIVSPDTPNRGLPGSMSIRNVVEW